MFAIMRSRRDYSLRFEQTPCLIEKEIRSFLRLPERPDSLAVAYNYMNLGKNNFLFLPIGSIMKD